MKKELETGRSPKGGKRPGSGTKSQGKVPGEVKKMVTVRMYPSKKKELETKFGSIQKAVDSL